MDTLALTVERDASCLPAFREALRVWLATVPLDDHVHHEIVLAAHEAVANALEHSASAACVSARLERGRIVVDVTSRGAWKDRPERPEERGRGLRIIRALMEQVSIEIGPDCARISMATPFR